MGSSVVLATAGYDHTIRYVCDVAISSCLLLTDGDLIGWPLLSAHEHGTALTSLHSAEQILGSHQRHLLQDTAVCRLTGQADRSPVCW